MQYARREKLKPKLVESPRKLRRLKGKLDVLRSASRRKLKVKRVARLKPLRVQVKAMLKAMKSKQLSTRQRVERRAWSTEPKQQ